MDKIIAGKTVKVAMWRKRILGVVMGGFPAGITEDDIVNLYQAEIARKEIQEAIKQLEEAGEVEVID